MSSFPYRMRRGSEYTSSKITYGTARPLISFLALPAEKVKFRDK